MLKNLSLHYHGLYSQTDMRIREVHPFSRTTKRVLLSEIPCLQKGHLYEPTEHPDPSSRPASTGLSGPVSYTHLTLPTSYGV